MLPKLAAALVATGLLSAVGWAVLAALGLLTDRSSLTRWAYGFALGWVLVGGGLWAGSLAGVLSIDRAGVLAVSAFWLLAAGLLRLLPGRQQRAAGPPRRALMPPPVAALLGLLLTSLGLEAVTSTAFDFDGRMTWSLHSRLLVDAGTVVPPALADRRVFLSHPQYPLLAPLGQAIYRIAAGPKREEFAARGFYFVCFLALLAVLADAARRLAGRRAAAWSTFFAATLPQLIELDEGSARSTYSDLPLALLLGAATALLIEKRTSLRLAATAGVLLAGALVVKNEGLVLVPIAIVLALVSPRQGGVRRRWPLLASVAPPALAWLLLERWQALVPNRFDEAHFERFNLGRTLAAMSDNLPFAISRQLERLADFTAWNLFWWLFALTLLAGWRGLRRRQAPLLAGLSLAPLAIAWPAFSLLRDPGFVGVVWGRLLVQVTLPLLLLFALALRAAARRPATVWALRELRAAWQTLSASAARPSLAASARLGVAEPGLALLAFAALAVLHTWPVARQLTTSLGPGLGDPLLNLYFLKWGARQWSLGLPDLWNAPFYFPTRGALALSDHLLGPAAFTAIAEKLGVNAIGSFNLLLLLAFATSGWAMYWVLRRSGLGALTSFVGGLAFTFSHFRQDHLTHLQLLLAQFVPLVLYLFDRLVERPSVSRVALFVATYWLHLAGGSYLALMIHLPMAVLLLNRLLRAEVRRDLLTRRHLALLVAAASLCVAFALWLYLPYAQFQSRLGIGRTLFEVQRHASPSWGLLTPANESGPRRWAPDLFPPFRPEACLYPGTAVLLLSGLGIALLLSASRRPPWRALSGQRRLAAWAALALVVAGLALQDATTLSARPGGGLPVSTYRTALVLLVAGAVGLWWALRSRPGSAQEAHTGSLRDLWPAGLLLGGAAALAIAQPAVYLFLRDLVPGLSGLRVPQRFHAVAAVAMVFLASWTLERLLGLFSRRSARWAVAAALALLVVAEVKPLHGLYWRDLPDDSQQPALYHRMRDNPAIRGLVILPLFGDYREGEWMYLATTHWKPIGNGYSGYHPPSFQRLAELFSPLPKPAGLDELRRLGFSHLAVHWDVYSADEREYVGSWFAARFAEDRLREVDREGPITLYALSPAPPAVSDDQISRKPPSN